MADAESPIQEWPRLGEALGIELWVKRDDLLPFPLAGNKVRKLLAERDAAGWAPGDLLISNGGVASNHARTLALLGARAGCAVHLVLHTDDPTASDALSLRLLDAAGATYDLVNADDIATSLEARARAYTGTGRVHVVPGGAHTRAAVAAYRDAAAELLSFSPVDQIVVASGTGATQAGLILGAQASTTLVRGISVARTHERGVHAIADCLGWFDAGHLPVHFDDRFRDDGYGRFGEETRAAVDLGWRHGLPLDPVYTGKAFRAVVELSRSHEIPPDSRVLFWHTGGLINFLENSR